MRLSIKGERQELAEQASRLQADRDEFKKRQAEIAGLFKEREQELISSYDDKFKALKESLEEISRVKEQAMLARFQQMEKQGELLAGQKDAALALVQRMKDENESLKNKMTARREIF